MARLKAKNMAGTTLTADITAEATSFGVANASLLPDCPFRVTIYSPDPQATAYEIVEVGAKDEVTNTLSEVQRGLEGTTASAHFAGAYVEAKWTAEMYEELETEAGAQAKADTAEANAKAYTDQEVGSVNADLSSHLNETMQQVGGVHGFEVEEGTWTPIIDAETTSPSVSYTMQEGYYVRNGNIAHVSFYIICTISGGSGITTITGLPFATDNYREAGNIGSVSHGTIATNYYGLSNSNALNEFRIMKDSRFAVLVSEINDGNTFIIQGSITYRI